MHQDVTQLLEIATAWAQRERYDAAAEAAELAVARDPEEVQAWFMLAVAHVKQRRYHSACACYAHIVQHWPTAVQAWCDLGEVLVELADYPRAARALEHAMALDPKADSPHGRRARAIVGRTLALLRKS